MTDKEVIENNKLIAEFLGYKYHPANRNTKPYGWHKIPKDKHWSEKLGWGINSYYLCRRHNQMQFHYDWNWLMVVVEKIMDITFDDNSNPTLDSEMFYEVRDCIPDINQTYKAIVEFIKWYNEEKL